VQKEEERIDAKNSTGRRKQHNEHLNTTNYDDTLSHDDGSSPHDDGTTSHDDGSSSDDGSPHDAWYDARHDASSSTISHCH
jgi:hypothetical protein